MAGNTVKDLNTLIEDARMQEGRRSINEIIRAELADLRDFMLLTYEDCLFHENVSTEERLSRLSTSIQIQIYMIEHITDLLDTMAGDPPAYLRTVFDLMQEAETITDGIASGKLDNVRSGMQLLKDLKAADTKTNNE